MKRIPTSLRLDPATVKLVAKAQEKAVEKRGTEHAPTQTDVIEGCVTLVLGLSDKAQSLLENASKKTGLKEERILEDCILAQLGGKAGAK